jgi:CRP-like cAMP-binding protein
LTAEISNGLLRLMSKGDLAFLTPHLQIASHASGDSLETAGTPSATVHFLQYGVSAVVVKLPNGKKAGVGVIGNEGMTGSALALGKSVPAYDCIAVGPCGSYKVSVECFDAALARSSKLRTLVMSYFHELAIQTAHAALVNARYMVELRVARMLLILEDRLPSPMSLTHDQIALIVGTRRPGITVALQIMESRGFIEARRGKVSILERDRLIDHTEGAYVAASS